MATSPATRQKDQVYLLNTKIDVITGSKLPSFRQCLGFFLYHHLDLKKTRREASSTVIETVLEFWHRARIPTRAIQHCQQKLEDLFDEWRALKKNMSRQTETQRKNEAQFCDVLEDLFDIAHADALELVKISEDREFLIAQREKGRRGCMAGVDVALHKMENRRVKREQEQRERLLHSQSEKEITSEVAVLTSTDSDSEVEAGGEELKVKALSEEESSDDQLPCDSRKRGRKVVITSEMTAALDRSKVSDRKVMMIVTETAKSLGHEVNELALNRETIRRSRQKHRKKMTEKIKEKFSADVPLVVHWDGKLLKDITGNDHVDRLPVIVTGEGISKLLNVAKLSSGTGEAQAKAVCDSLREWDLEQRVIGISFDTTSSNTGWISGACIRIQQALGRNLLFLACRHHVFELVIGAVFHKCLGPSGGPDLPIFKRFKEQWPFIDQHQYHDVTSSEQAASQVADIQDSIIQFVANMQSQSQPRDDYREMLELVLIYLGITPHNEVHFMAPGAIHQARWMAKVLYTMKIWLFRLQFKLTAKEESGLSDICIFVVRLYVKAWFTAPNAAAAPANDLQFLKDLVAYEAVNPLIGKVSADKFASHLWYLSQELVGLSLFDDHTSHEEKSAIIKAIQDNTANDDEDPPKKAIVDLKTINDRQLHSFASTRSGEIFKSLNIATTFLQQDPALWSSLESFQVAKKTVSALTVVNDNAERGVALVQDYSGLLTRDEQQLQFLLQVVEEHRRRYPDPTKKALLAD